MSSKYSIKSIKKIISDPRTAFSIPQLLVEDIKRLPLRINRHWYQYKYNNKGDKFVDSDWDNLIILDAARFDILNEINESDVDSRYSPGSCSINFMESEFIGRQLHDTVYITANPHVHDIPDSVFFKVINLLENDWDPKLKTVRPQSVVKAAISANKKYPNKRLIIHFMQPHFPFIGKNGEKIHGGIGKSIEEDDTPHPWFEQMWGKKNDRDTLLKAYRENHEIVLPYAKSLTNELNGKSIITADHANLIGERGFPIPIRMYGHPRQFPHPNLLKVPWIEVENERRKIISEPPIKKESMDNNIVQDRLEALGYA